MENGEVWVRMGTGEINENIYFYYYFYGILVAAF